MATITISRHFGAGGATLGEGLSKRLGYRYVNDQLIKEVAKNVGVSSGRVRTIEKKGTSKLMKLLDKIVNADSIDRQVIKKHGFIDERRYVDEVTAIIQKLHEEGNVVIIGRGSNYTLKGYDDVINILLVADMEYRTRFLMDKYEMNQSQAEQAVKRGDMIRTRFLNCFSDKEFHDDPLLYDLVLNMNHVSMKQAEEIVLKLVP
jgi:cytidylate kinase